MKNLTYLSILLLFSCENSTEISKPTSNKELVEIVIADLDNDNIPDTVRMIEEPEFDPGEFMELTIAFSSLEHFHAKANEVWDSIPQTFTKQHSNAVKSDRIFVSKKSGGTFILLFGYPYPTGTCELSVIHVGDHKAQMQQISQFKEAEAFTDLDGNGTMELIGRNNYEIFETSDSLNADIGTYSPFYVMSYMKNGHSEFFRLDSNMTKRYNIDTYIWNGIDYNEHLKVVYPHHGGKPYLVN